MKLELKLFFSLLLGIIGIILITCNLMVALFPFPGASPSNLGESISKQLLHIFGTVVQIFFLGVMFLSCIGIVLGVKSMKQRFKIFAIALNFFNFLLSLLIAWLLFGLARGM